MGASVPSQRFEHVTLKTHHHSPNQVFLQVSIHAFSNNSAQR
ncbi:hypothetical protein PFLA_b0002 [Pseudoalteromonas flavipulchra NCIMB 2033 = ATCC BAA-314]|nr:hypothetical protein [Pseudoalteromonas flavipulchra NCIMB 2033 = ATCC BAA-314]